MFNYYYWFVWILTSLTVNVCVLQLPEPIMPFRLYNRLMGLAKESLQGEGEEAESSATNPAVVRGPELVNLGSNTDPQILVLVDSLKEVLKELPKANFSTLRYIVRHLRRSVTPPVYTSVRC